MGVCSTSIKAFLASSPHGVDKVSQHCLQDIEPFLLQQVEQLVAICGRWMVVPEPATKDVPHVFDGRKVRGTSWPVHAGNVLLLEEVGHYTGSMGGGVVVLKHCPLSNGSQCGDDVGLDDLVSVSETGQIALDVVKWGSAMQVEASPHHY